MGKIIRYIMWVLVIALITMLILSAFWSIEAKADSEEPGVNSLYVISNSLNGRFRPDKKSMLITEFEFGQELHPTGKWSNDRMWVEIEHPEYGLMWVNVNYVSERMDVFEVYTLNDDPIKARSKPGGGKVKSYIRKNRHISISQVVLGYGKCQYGWVDLGYFIEEE